MQILLICLDFTPFSKPRIGWWSLENLVPQDSDQAWARRVTNKRQETIQTMYSIMKKYVSTWNM